MENVKEGTKFKATKKIRIFVEGKIDVSKVPISRRIRTSWKGCYYDIKENEYFYFLRSNYWDVSYFKLINGAEFHVYCSDPMRFIKKHLSIKQK